MANHDIDSACHPGAHAQPTIPRSPSPRSRHRDKSTELILTGFRQANGIRSYMYQCQHEDGSSSEFTVDAEVNLLQKHGIGLQELPLLCRRVLEKQNSDVLLRTVTFTEDLMKEQADQRTALKQAAQNKRKPHRKPRPGLSGPNRG